MTYSACIFSNTPQRCDLEVFKHKNSFGSTVDGLMCRRCGHLLTQDCYVLVGTPKDKNESPSFTFNSGGFHPGKYTYQVLRCNKEPWGYSVYLNNGLYYAADWVLWSYDTSQANPPDHSNTILPDRFVGPVPPNTFVCNTSQSIRIQARVPDVMVPGPEAQACICRSLLFGHSPTCTWAKQQKLKHVAEGKFWR